MQLERLQGILILPLGAGKVVASIRFLVFFSANRRAQAETRG